MAIYFFWDIENVSFHNLGNIMVRVHECNGKTIPCVVYSKIKESRKDVLLEQGWMLLQAESVSRNCADRKIKEMIRSVLEDENSLPEKIFIITEDKGFFKISKEILGRGIPLEILCGTKNPPWIHKLRQPEPGAGNKQDV
jgi:hypothetical protein